MQKTSTTQVRRIIQIQILATSALSVLLLVLGPVYAWSSLAGGLIATLANGYFAWKVNLRQQETSPGRILAIFYGAEVGKIILTVMLFVAVFVMIKPLSVIAMMSVYLVNQFVPWLVSFYFPDDNRHILDR